MNVKSPLLVFHDAIYSKIIIDDPLIRALIYTPEFQRLKYLRQLGTLSLTVYALPMHTRFSHSLGVYHLLNCLFRRPNFTHLVSKTKQEVIIAGLLHDLGHGPFSHIFEKVLSDFKHEDYSAKIITNRNGNIYPLLVQQGLNVKRIVDLILHRTQNDWAQTLISGQFDLDRLDYLLRDRYFLGLSNSGINLDRLLDNIFLKENKLLFREKALLDLENYLIFRFYMHKTFFWDAENVFLDNLFVSIFRRLQTLWKEKCLNLDLDLPFLALVSDQNLDLNSFFQLTDHNILTFFTSVRQKSEDVILQKLINVFLTPSTPWPYLLDFTVEDIKKIESKGWPRTYFYYQNHFSLDIYRKEETEIYIWTDDHQQKKFSEVSMFFDRDRIYRKKLSLLLKI